MTKTTAPTWKATLSRWIKPSAGMTKASRRNRIRDELRFEWRADALESRLLFDGDPIVVDPLVAGDAPSPIVGDPAPAAFATAGAAANSTITFLGLPDPDARIDIHPVTQPATTWEVGREAPRTISVDSGETVFEIEVAADVRGRLVASFENDVVDGRMELRDQDNGLLVSADASELDRHLGSDITSGSNEPTVYRLHVQHTSPTRVNLQIEFTPAVAPVMQLGDDRVGVGEFQSNAKPISIQEGDFFTDSDESGTDIAILFTDDEGAGSLVIGSSLSDGSFSPRRVLMLNSSLESQPLEFRAADFSGNEKHEIAILYRDHVDILSIDGVVLKTLDASNVEALNVETSEVTRLELPGADATKAEQDSLAIRNLDAADVDGDNKADLGIVTGRQAFIITDVLGSALVSSPFETDTTTEIKAGFMAIGLGVGEAFVVRSIRLPDGTASSRLERAAWDGAKFSDTVITKAGSLSFYSSGVADPARTARIDVLDLDDIENTRHVVSHDRYSAQIWTITETGSSLTEADISLEKNAIAAGKFIDATDNGLQDLITEQAKLSLNLRQTPTDPDQLGFASVFSANLIDRDSLTAFLPGHFNPGDSNEDKRVDLLYGATRSLGGYAVRIGLGTTLNNYQLEQTANGLSPLTGTVSGDFNGDGLDDFVSVTSGGSATFFQGLGNGTFLDPVSVNGLKDGLGFARDVIAQDFNGDGRTDLAMLRGFVRESETDRYRLQFLLGSGDGNFTEVRAPVDVAGVGFDPNALRLQTLDWNQDSVTDFAVLHGRDVGSLNYVVSIFDGAAALRGESQRLATWETGRSNTLDITTNAVLIAQPASELDDGELPRLALSIQDTAGSDVSSFLAVLRPLSETNPAIASTVVTLHPEDIVQDIDWVVGEQAANALPGLVVTYANRVEVYREQATGWSFEEVLQFERRDDQDTDSFNFVDTVVVAFPGQPNRIMTADASSNIVRFASTEDDSSLRFGFSRNSAVEVNNLLVGDFIGAAGQDQNDGSVSLLYGGLSTGFEVVGNLGTGRDPVAAVQVSSAELQPIYVDLTSDGIADTVTLDASNRLYFQRGNSETSDINQRVELASSITSFVVQTFEQGGETLNRLVAVQDSDIATSVLLVFEYVDSSDALESTEISLPSRVKSLRLATNGETVFVVDTVSDVPQLFQLDASNNVTQMNFASSVALDPFDTSVTASSDRLLIANQRSGLIQVFDLGGNLIQKFSSSDQAQSSVSFGGETELVIGDIDGDGRDDLAALNRGTRDIAIRFGSEQGLFGGISKVIHLPHAPYSVAVSDVDLDGDLDLVVTLDDQRDFFEDILAPTNVKPRVIGFESRDEQLLVLKNDGEGDFDLLTDSVALGVAALPTRITVIDSNGDDYADLLMSNNEGDAIIYLGQGNEAIPFVEPPPRLNAGTGNDRVELDVAAVTGQSNPIAITSSDLSGQILLQEYDEDIAESGSELAKGDLLEASEPEGIQLIDVNADGVADAIYTNVNSNQLIVHYGSEENGAPFFLDTKVSFAVGTNPTDFAVLDPSNGTDASQVIIAVFNKGSNDISIVYPGDPDRSGSRLKLDTVSQVFANEEGFSLENYAIAVENIAFADNTADADLVVQLNATPINANAGLSPLGGFALLDNVGNGFFSDQNVGGPAPTGPIIDAAFLNGDIYALLGNQSIQRFGLSSGRDLNITRRGVEGSRLLGFRGENTDFLAIGSDAGIEFLNLDGTNLSLQPIDITSSLGGLDDFVFYEPMNLLYLVDSGETVTVFELDFVTNALDLSGLLAQLGEDESSGEGVVSTSETVVESEADVASLDQETLTSTTSQASWEEFFGLDSESSLSEYADAFFKTMVSLIRDSSELADQWSDSWHQWKVDTLPEGAIEWLEWTTPMAGDLASPMVFHVSQLSAIGRWFQMSIDGVFVTEDGAEASETSDEPQPEWSFETAVAWWQENFEKVWKSDD